MIGILTFHTAKNYGAFLQTYALQTTILNKFNLKSEIVDYRPKYHLSTYYLPWEKYPKWKYYSGSILRYGLSILYTTYNNCTNYHRRKLRNKYFEEASEKLVLSNQTYTNDNVSLSNLPNKYSLLIAGSDQLWNPNLTGGSFDPVYFLSFPNTTVHKATYAVSMMHTSLLSKNAVEEFINLLSCIENISVRESSIMNFIKDECHVSCVTSLDPTLLLSKTEWCTFSMEPKKHPEHYVLYYNLSGSKGMTHLVYKIAKKLSIPIVTIHTGKIPLLSPGIYVRPEEFVWYFDHADFVVTDSFHGTVLSLLHRKPFYTIVPHPRNERIVNLLCRLGIRDRTYESGELVTDISADIDYDAVEDKLNILRTESWDYLRKITIYE